jgi:uncharacterized protein YbcV (DUF1398 family)
MNADQIRSVQECAALSAAGRIHFGEVVERLTLAGIERYHADYCRKETTYYAPDGDSLLLPLEHAGGSIADAFSASGLESAVRQAQRGEIMYPEFTRQALEAGCVGYFVQLSGRCVQYFGRHGEIHTERFPGSP